MDSKPQQEKGRDGALPMVNVAVDELNLAMEKSSIAPAKAVFGSVGDLLPKIRDSMANREDYVALGLGCADVCRALDRGLDGRQADQLSRPVLEAIEQLTTAVAQIQRSVVKLGERNSGSRVLHATNDKDAVARWKSELDRILQVFKTKLALHTNVGVSDIRQDVASTRELVSDIHRTVVKGWEGNQTTQASIPGESPPPPPRACFGRGELIEKIIGFVENLAPIALVGTGGIGKTSVALTVLHEDRIKKRFGENRRFIRCDQFQPALASFLNRLSQAIGAGVKSPEDLTPLRPFLSSKEMLIILDNAESILDPQETDARDIYAVVEELSLFSNISLCITSRISTLPPHCNRLTIPTLSMESACDVFYAIYRNSGRSDIVRDLIQQLDFHALSITLLATTAVHNMWGYDRLAKEWEARRAQVLRTDYNQSLAATIELSLASPTFRKLGPNARELLGVVAFLPQGVNENNLNWLFPTISDGQSIFDKFCVLSLTHRSNGFLTMLAPLRDYLGPRDPRTSSLLCITQDRYFSRLQLWDDLEYDKPGFEESRWITSEDVNVEHLLNVSTSLDKGSDNIWDTCAKFLMHLGLHKPRSTVLRPKMEGLPDDRLSKPQCLFELSLLLRSLGNDVERKWHLTHLLELERGQGNSDRVARTLRHLADANRMLHLYQEGIEQSKEALEIHKQLGDVEGQAKCWNYLGWLLVDDQQLDAAEEAGSYALKLSLNQGRKFWVCESYRLLGVIARFKGEREKAIQHFGAALDIASPFNWHHQLFWIHHSLAWLFYNENEFSTALAHVERAKSHAIDNAYCLSTAMSLNAFIWYQQGRLEEAKLEALQALETFEKLGATNGLLLCREFLGNFELAVGDVHVG